MGGVRYKLEVYRQCMPHIVTLNYTMLRNPSLEMHYYVDDDQQPVAGFVCGISEIMHQHTDDILVVSTTQLPSLEDPLVFT